MRLVPTFAVTASLALALGGPVLAQRSQPGGDRGNGPRPDSTAGRPEPRNGPTGAPIPTLPGLGSASLIAPRPGVDVFRADPSTYGGRRERIIAPRGPSWGGVPLSSTPSWGGKPLYGDGGGKSDHAGNGRDDHDRRGRRHGRGNIYMGTFAPAYAVPYGYLPYGIAQPVVTGQSVTAAPTQADVPEGFLRLLITPRHADVIVDGVAAGTVDDFGGVREQTLVAGPHRIRVEAPGYESVEFDVRVPVGDTISLRRELSRLPAPPRATAPQAPEPNAASQAPAVRKTFYAIPNCYLGDSIPKAELLPAGCSLKDMRVLPPQ